MKNNVRNIKYLYVLFIFLSCSSEYSEISKKLNSIDTLYTIRYGEGGEDSPYRKLIETINETISLEDLILELKTVTSTCGKLYILSILHHRNPNLYMQQLKSLNLDLNKTIPAYHYSIKETLTVEELLESIENSSFYEHYVIGFENSK